MGKEGQRTIQKDKERQKDEAMPVSVSSSIPCPCRRSCLCVMCGTEGEEGHAVTSNERVHFWAIVTCISFQLSICL